VPIEDGTTSMIIARPDGFRSGETVGVILAHGAGNDMTNPVVSAVHEGIARRGHLAVKFNFAFKERGGRRPDPPRALQSCFRRVVEAVRDEGPRSVVLGGKSLGGRMASHLAADGFDCAGLLLLGYPLHPPRKTEQLRAAHLGSIAVPMLFFAGTRDPLCNLDLLRAAIAGLKADVTLHVIEGGDHSFAVPKRSGRSQEEVLAEIVDKSADWLARKIR
jgi:predicted alpha/beta-hydrolase family hydrolase